MADLVIKINGDLKSFEDALEKAEKKTESLESGLQSIAKVSAVAFAALTAEVGLSVKAFAESQKASRELSASLQNQGIYSKSLTEEYKKQASELQTLTGVDDDAIVKSQALLQSFIGQTAITKPLSLAILDLSAAKGMDLQSTTELVGKGIAGHTTALKKLGIEIDENLSKEERQAKIIEQVTLKFGGQAEAANQGLGSIRGLTSAFGDFQENIGAKFAPIIEVGIKALTRFIEFMNKSPEVANFAAALLSAGLVVSGLVTTLTLGGLAFLKIKAAMDAAGIATSALTLGVRGLVGATGLGLLVIVATELFLHWNSIWPRMQAVFKTFVDNIGPVVTALGALILNLFSPTKFAEGVAALKAALAKGFTDYEVITKEGLAKIAATEAAGEEKQKASKAAAAARQKQIDDRKAADKKASLEAEADLEWQIQNQATQDRIDLGKQEVELLRKLQDEKYAGLREDILRNLETTRAMIVEQDKLDDEYRAAAFEELLAKNDEYQAMTEEQQAQFQLKNRAALENQILNESLTRDAAAKKKLAKDVQDRNQFLADQQQFGIAYATINAIMHSQIYQGTKQAAGELAQLQSSSNATLKTIGKAAAIANIVIKSGESAMNIFAGFSTIPIIGPALGIAGAAAAIAFGAEQIGTVIGAARGGLLTGGVPGIDSIPVMGQAGELISPAQNFDEVIGSVRAGREAEKFINSGESSGGGSAHVVVEFIGDLASVIEAKIIERQNQGISLIPRFAGA